MITDNPEINAVETQPCQMPWRIEVGLGVSLVYKTALRQQDQQGALYSPVIGLGPMGPLSIESERTLFLEIERATI